MMNPNIQVQEAKSFALGTIQSIEDLTIDLEKGLYTGRLYSKLIDGDPINLALQAINDYQKMAKDYNTPIEKCITEGMENAENTLINTLITLAKNGDKEAITVIEQIVNTNNYGLQALNRMQELKTAINLQEEFSITATTNFPNEILIKIFSECGVKELGRLMLSSKLYYKLANSEQTWKHICLKEDPTNLNKKNLNWKKLYIDEIDLKEYSRGRIIIIIPLQGGVNHPIQVNLKSKNITGKELKAVIKKSLNLNCKLDSMSFRVAGSYIEDTDDSVKLNILFDKSGDRLLLSLKKVAVKSTQSHVGPEIKDLVIAENTQTLKTESEIKDLVVENNQPELKIHEKQPELEILEKQPEIEILEIAEEEVEEETKSNSYCLLM